MTSISVVILVIVDVVHIPRETNVYILIAILVIMDMVYTQDYD